jgi:hypothetical protein
MNYIIKRNPLVYIASIVLFIVITTSAMMFSGTYAWFVKTLDDVTIDGEMGTVKVSVADDKIINGSNIEIILRVRVIAEWIAEPGTTGVPPGDIPINTVITNPGADWEIKGQFLVYKSGTAVTGIPAPYSATEEKFIDLPAIITLLSEDSNNTNVLWKSQVTFIVEALQATENAYTYTLTHGTSWALGGVGP